MFRRIQRFLKHIWTDRPSMRRLAFILATLAVLASAGVASAREPVLVFAAASTRDAMEEVIAAFEGADVKGVYAASSALARQILDGAPASVFLSANTAWADELDKAGLLAERRDFLRNRLVVVAPRTAAAGLSITKATDISKALGEERLAMGGIRAVPVGVYARQALVNLGVWDDLRDRVAQASNARAALLLVERGEAPLGIVYATDARASADIRAIWEIPAKAHDPIVYPLALLETALTNPDAIAFSRFLASPKARAIFLRHWFEVD
jgi:molybdate transport system substrate-binding protein